MMCTKSRTLCMHCNGNGFCSVANCHWTCPRADSCLVAQVPGHKLPIVTINLLFSIYIVADKLVNHLSSLISLEKSGIST